MTKGRLTTKVYDSSLCLSLYAKEPRVDVLGWGKLSAGDACDFEGASSRALSAAAADLRDNLLKDISYCEARLKILREAVTELEEKYIRQETGDD